MRTFSFHLAIVVVAMLAIAPAVAHAALPAKLKVGETELVLNGAGSRSKYLMQMYIAGLYLAKPSDNAVDIVVADEPMAIRIEVTSGLVTQEKLVESLDDGFARSTGGRIEAIVGEIEQFRRCFAAPITKGDVFDLVYLPTHGVVVLKNGKRQGVVAGHAFKQAMFSIWLSDNPADRDLRLALLNQKSQWRAE